MKFSSKIGLQTVMSAVRKSLEEELTDNVKLLGVAKALKMEKTLRNHRPSTTRSTSQYSQPNH